MGPAERGQESISRFPRGSFELLGSNAVISVLEHGAVQHGMKIAKMPVAEREGRTLVVAVPQDQETIIYVQAALALARNGADQGPIEIDTTGEVNG